MTDQARGAIILLRSVEDSLSKDPHINYTSHLLDIAHKVEEKLRRCRAETLREAADALSQSDSIIPRNEIWNEAIGNLETTFRDMADEAEGNDA